MLSKVDTYKRIKIAGMLFFVSFVLASGPITGYFIGAYLQNKFSLSVSVIPISIIVGILVSALEAIRIIRLILAADKKKA